MIYALHHAILRLAERDFYRARVVLSHCHHGEEDCSGRHGETNEVPDGNIITGGAKPFRCVEGLLQQGFTGTGASDFTTLLSRAT